MPRQLVVCLDGTGNRFSHTNTNVVRVLRSLQRDQTQVIPFYDPGVGTFGLKEATFQVQKLPSKVLGLALGWGFDCVVEAGYNFLAQNYRPNDEI